MTTKEKVDWEIEVKEAEKPKELPRELPETEPQKEPAPTRA